MSRSKCVCGEPVKCAGLCGNHYNVAHYWLKKGLARTAKHVEGMKVRAEILDGARGIPTPTNVVELQSHPRFVAKRVCKGAKRRKRAAS